MNKDRRKFNIIDDQVKCMICGKYYKMVHTVHLRTHGLEFNEYKNKFPGVKTHSDYVLEKYSKNGSRLFKEFGVPSENPKIAKKISNSIRKNTLSSGMNCKFCGIPISKRNNYGSCGKCYYNVQHRKDYMKKHNSLSNYVKINKFSSCIECGKKIWEVSERCKSCARKKILRETPGIMKKLAHLSNISQRGHCKIPPRDNNGKFCKFCKTKDGEGF